MLSDEYNGVNQGEDGKARPFFPKFLSLDDAIDENQRSRVYLGVHWNMDSTEGGKLGAKIASNIVSSFPKKA